MFTAFSPRKQAITLYPSSEFKERDTLPKALGKHSCGAGCVYIKRLSDVHLPTLKKLVKASVRHTKKNGSRSSDAHRSCGDADARLDCQRSGAGGSDVRRRLDQAEYGWRGPR